MNRKILFLVAALAGAVSSAAFAFQEVQQGGGRQPAPAVEAAVPAAGKGLGLTVPDIGAKGSSGTEVRIPGLGKLGVLPKLDFGLELLYGATEPRDIPPGRQQSQDDVTIRGSLKHRF